MLARLAAFLIGDLFAAFRLVCQGGVRACRVIECGLVSAHNESLLPLEMEGDGGDGDSDPGMTRLKAA